MSDRRPVFPWIRSSGILWGIGGVLWAGGVWLASSQTGFGGYVLPFVGADKIMHAGIFGVGALLWARSMPRSSGPSVILLLVGLGLYGALDEYHQSWVPGRDASIADLIADLTGIAFALGWVVRRRIAGRFTKSPAGTGGS